VEEQLFAGLAAQAGLVLRSVRLRAQLAVRLTESTRRAHELSASRERIIAAQDEERRRLARNIHDGAQQHLVALAVNLRLARTLVARSPDRLPAALTELIQVAEDTIGTLSDLSRGIYPRALSERGLAAALGAVVAVSSLPVDLAVEPLPRPRPDIEATLYFCCLEALQNAAKHSAATRAAVRLGRTADGLVLAVSDDGTGFVPHTVGLGHGLVNMRDRAESVGGRLRVDSAPGRGTQIQVLVPWAAAAERGDA
jgi:signal transduction histidine kinase